MTYKINYYSILFSLNNQNSIKLQCDGKTDKFTFNEVSDYMAKYLRNYRKQGYKVKFLWSEHNLPSDIKQTKNKNQRRLLHYYIVSNDEGHQYHLTFVKA